MKNFEKKSVIKSIFGALFIQMVTNFLKKFKLSQDLGGVLLNLAKNKMVEFRGDLCYNLVVFQAPFPEEQGNCFRHWNT